MAVGKREQLRFCLSKVLYHITPVQSKRTVESGSNLDRLQRLKASDDSRDYQMHTARSKNMLSQTLDRQKNKSLF